MNIYCDDLAVFREVKEKAPRHQLQRLLMRVLSGVHALILADLDSFYESPFFTTAVATGDRLEVEEVLREQNPALGDRGLDPAKRAPGPRAELVPVTFHDRVCRRENGHPVWEMDPSTAGDWSEQPLRVLLENDNDWELIAVAARLYPNDLGSTSSTNIDQLSRVIVARQQKHIHLDQRGGISEVKKAVESCTLEERIFVLVDSDKITNIGEEGAHQQKIRELAQSRPNVHVFVLEKREAENYLPEPVLQDFVNRQWPQTSKKKIDKQRRNHAELLQKKLEKWKSLPADEKDHVDLAKDYFGERIKPEVAKLNDPSLVPDSQTLESRDYSKNLKTLAEELEALL